MEESLEQCDASMTKEGTKWERPLRIVLYMIIGRIQWKRLVYGYRVHGILWTHYTMIIFNSIYKLDQHCLSS